MKEIMKQEYLLFELARLAYAPAKRVENYNKVLLDGARRIS